MPIASFAHKELKKLFVTGTSKIGERYKASALDILDLLDAATCAKDLVGAKNFHGLTGDLAGFYSMHVNGNWTIIFKFKNGDEGDVLDVNLVDYH